MTDDRRDDDRLDIADELGAYLLGALSPEEEKRVEELLATSEGVRKRALYMRPAVEMLAEAVPRREPPAELRSRILAEVGLDESVATPQPEPELARPRRSWFQLPDLSLQPAMGLAAILLVLVVGAVGYMVGTGGDGTGGRSTPPQSNPTGTARLTIDDDHGTLELTNLSPPPPGEVYQAWVQRNGKMVPSSLFAVRSNGTASAAIPHDLNDADAVVVTAEPTGGSLTPTGPILTSVRLPG